MHYSVYKLNVKHNIFRHGLYIIQFYCMHEATKHTVPIFVLNKSYLQTERLVRKRGPKILKFKIRFDLHFTLHITKLS